MWGNFKNNFRRESVIQSVAQNANAIKRNSNKVDKFTFLIFCMGKNSPQKVK